VGPADKRACFAIGLRRHAAGIHNHHIGVRQRLQAMPPGAQTLGNGLAIGTRCPAPKVLDVK
jgi:hypothetical protein